MRCGNSKGKSYIKDGQRVESALRCHGLPFEVKTDEPNETTYEAMESAQNNEDLYGPFDSVKDLMSELF